MTIKEAFALLANNISAGMKNPFFIARKLHDSFVEIAVKLDVDDSYSADEQLIGTWIDGKPLFQKTVVITDFSAFNGTSRQWRTVYQGLNNIDTIFVKTAFSRWNNNGTKYVGGGQAFINDVSTPGQYYDYQLKSLNNAVSIQVLNSGPTPVLNYGDVTDFNMVFVLQYTKSS